MIPSESATGSRAVAPTTSTRQTNAGCSGACCAAFYCSTTLSELRRRTDRDGVYIAAMLITLTPKQARERSALFGGTLSTRWASRGHYFACRHWDEETRLCTAYDQRPAMCADYPYGKPCEMQAGCKVAGRASD